MGTFATLAFIGGVAAAGGYLAQKPTVVDGKVMAADLLGQLRQRDITHLECDERIPIGPAGAVFRCLARGRDGSTATIQYTMDREGSLDARLVDSTGPTERRIPRSGDPWAD